MFPILSELFRAGRLSFLFAAIMVAAFIPARAEGYTATITPAAIGEQLVRTSLPLPSGLLVEGQQLIAHDGPREWRTAVRPLSWHPVADNKRRSVRRALVTFPFFFLSTNTVKFSLRPVVLTNLPAQEWPMTVAMQDGMLMLNWKNGPRVKLNLLAPQRTSTAAPRLEIVEENHVYRWQRWHFADPQWPRIIEVRMDALGGVVLIAHLQSNLPEDGAVPDFGWAVKTAATSINVFSSHTSVTLSGEPFRHDFTAGTAARFTLGTNGLTLYHPTAPLKRRGHIDATFPETGQLEYRYYRCTTNELVPMQPTSWQRAEIVIAPASLAPLTVTLESPHQVKVAPTLWQDLYHLGHEPVVALPSELNALLDYHRNAMVRSMAVGDDWGNVTGYSDSQPHGGYYGMNRLNHGAPIFAEGWRSGDRRLLETAVLWCDNFYDQSIWWGEKKPGGTRLNSVTYEGKTPRDNKYMWRSNKASDFCTKGYDCFWLAYEQTGDPRMKEALAAQVNYAMANVHVDKGECRNIGDVRDCLRLYRYTGEQRYLTEALRLFRELRTKLTAENLFDQGGKPIDPDPPYIEDDDVGIKIGYAKPYIIGYALAGLPELATLAPNEPRLRETVRAVADFLVASQDPAGGWRYPHPHSSSLSMAQAIEHAWQITQAARVLGSNNKYLDAIERVLWQRIQGWLQTGQTLNMIAGWEKTTGKVKTTKELYDLYKKPADRDPTRDYTEGRAGFGGSAPEGIVYFPEVLAFYLQHRPASRLLASPAPDEPLGRVLARATHQSSDSNYQTNGIVAKLPVFYQKLADKLNFPLSWRATNHGNFTKWRETAQAKVYETMLRPPGSAPFEPKVIATEDRGSYVARKVVFNLTAESRVLAYLLVPKGEGTFPAVLMLHDHGGKFDIGKEKVIRPFGDSPERIESARLWSEKYYSGRFIGDELAKRGYVCLAVDLLNWGDRGGAGSDGQQSLAANLMQFGMSFAGLIAYEDLRSLEFLATRGKVDTNRIAAMGLSMGGYRAWQVAALSDRIAAGVSVCWMATTKGLMVPKNNQTTGFGAFCMTHPGLVNFLDYPDVASIAAPKPMMFLSGRRDHLFPVASIADAYETMRKVWDSQNAGANLETRLYDAPHEFNAGMQDEAFDWLDLQLKPAK
jgi:dienelactone hydrolase